MMPDDALRDLIDRVGPDRLGPLRVSEFGMASDDEPTSVVLHRGEFDWEALHRGEQDGIWLDAERYDEAVLLAHLYNQLTRKDQQ